jgi:peptidoglycan/xylan/chitin deacetylase (PgdA/CDA1 family)
LRRLLVAALALGLWALPLWSEVWFSELDLSGADRLLFQAEADCPGFGPYRTLFSASLPDGRLQQLTFFPERAVFLAGKGALQLENRYGLFRTDAALNEPQPLSGAPSFLGGAQVKSGKLDPHATSPNGRFLLALRPSSPAYGELVVYDLEQPGEGTVVSTGVEFSLKSIPALWSPDSEFFLYSRQGSLYYFSVNQLADRQVLAEPLRLVGPGTIRNVRWGADSLPGTGAGSTLYYASGSLVYQLEAGELFARTLYGGYLPIGHLAGKLPFELDPGFDDFWIAPDGAQVLVNKGGRNLFLVPLTMEDYSGQTRSLPYLLLPGSSCVRRVLWTRAGWLTVLTESRARGGRSTAVFRLALASAASLPAFQRTSDEGVLDLVLSSDESTVAALRADGVTLLDVASWQKRQYRSHPHPLAAVWTPRGELVIAGAWLTELWSPAGGTSRTLCLSQPGGSSFSQDEACILTEVQGAVYRRPAAGGESRGWSATGSASLRERRTASAGYRAYLEDSPDRWMRNRILLRDLRGYGTRELLPEPARHYEPFPPAEEPGGGGVFAHGSRLRRREVALVFDAVDAVEGLASILSTLEEYRIHATFFVNGEALRRYPDAVREIAEAGHEVGSLFYADFNMTDARFQVDKEFIKRGLASTEDEYHAATGRELALLWHAPFYFAGPQAIEASREMNYTYVSRDVDTLDWVTAEAGKAAPDIYLPASELVDRIIAKKKPGSILPVLVGRPDGLRADFLFQKVDLLVDALQELGYSVVTVSTLMEHAR